MATELQTAESTLSKNSEPNGDGRKTTDIFPEGVNITQVGIVFTRDLGYEEWESIAPSFRLRFDKLALRVSELQWALGDWLNYGEARYGETYSQALNDTGFEYGYLADMRSMASKYPIHERVDGLSWSHHKLVRAKPDRLKLLAEAKANGQTVSRLREELSSDDSRNVRFKPKVETRREPEGQGKTAQDYGKIVADKIAENRSNPVEPEKGGGDDGRRGTDPDKRVHGGIGQEVSGEAASAVTGEDGSPLVGAGEAADAEDIYFKGVNVGLTAWDGERQRLETELASWKDRAEKAIAEGINQAKEITRLQDVIADWGKVSVELDEMHNLNLDAYCQKRNTNRTDATQKALDDMWRKR